MLPHISSNFKWKHSYFNKKISIKKEKQRFTKRRFSYSNTSCLVRATRVQLALTPSAESVHMYIITR